MPIKNKASSLSREFNYNQVSLEIKDKSIEYDNIINHVTEISEMPCKPHGESQYNQYPLGTQGYLKTVMISIESSFDNVFTMKVSPYDEVFILKSYIGKKINLEPRDFSLYFQGELMGITRIILDYLPYHDCTIKLVLNDQSSL